MDIEIIDTGLNSAEENMRIDRELLSSLEERKKPVLHLYGWEKGSLTYGCLLDIEKFLYVPALKKQGFSPAKRPTGGGVIFHDWDFAFSFLIPTHSSLLSASTLENYRIINGWVQQFLLKEWGVEALFLEKEQVEEEGRFCMAYPTQFDLMTQQGRKIVGAAQRRTKQGLLHQGSIALCMPQKEELRQLFIDGSVYDKMQKNTAALFPSQENLVEKKEELKRGMGKYFKDCL